MIYLDCIIHVFRVYEVTTLSLNKNHENVFSNEAQALTPEKSAYGRVHLHVAVRLRHVNAEVHEAVRVAPLVVVPGNKLDEALVQRNARLDVEDGRKLASDEVRSHNLVVGPAQDPM